MFAASAVATAPASRLDSFSYDDSIVRKFLWATIIWGLVGFLMGLIVAIQMAFPQFNLASWFSFGRGGGV